MKVSKIYHAIELTARSKRTLAAPYSVSLLIKLAIQANKAAAGTMING
jgi:hypothetical protein